MRKLVLTSEKKRARRDFITMFLCGFIIGFSISFAVAKTIYTLKAEQIKIPLQIIIEKLDRIGGAYAGASYYDE